MAEVSPTWEIENDPPISLQLKKEPNGELWIHFRQAQQPGGSKEVAFPYRYFQSELRNSLTNVFTGTDQKKDDGIPGIVFTDEEPERSAEKGGDENVIIFSGKTVFELLYRVSGKIEDWVTIHREHSGSEKQKRQKKKKKKKRSPTPFVPKTLETRKAEEVEESDESTNIDRFPLKRQNGISSAKTIRKGGHSTQYPKIPEAEMEADPIST